MAEQEISGILRKIDLEGLVENFYEKDEKLGLKYQSLIMMLRIECSAFGSFYPPKQISDTKQANFRYQNSY